MPDYLNKRPTILVRIVRLTRALDKNMAKPKVFRRRFNHG